MFKTKSFYIRVYTNRLVIEYIEKKISLDKTSIIPFSNNRLVLANFKKFESFLSDSIKQLTKSKNHFLDTNRFLFQVMEKNQDGLCDVELRAFVDSGTHANGKIIKIYISNNKLSNNTVLEILNSKIKLPHVLY